MGVHGTLASTRRGHSQEAAMALGMVSDLRRSRFWRSKGGAAFRGRGHLEARTACRSEPNMPLVLILGQAPRVGPRLRVRVDVWYLRGPAGRGDHHVKSQTHAGTACAPPKRPDPCRPSRVEKAVAFSYTPNASRARAHHGPRYLSLLGLCVPRSLSGRTLMWMWLCGPDAS